MWQLLYLHLSMHSLYATVGHDTTGSGRGMEAEKNSGFAEDSW